MNRAQGVELRAYIPEIYQPEIRTLSNGDNVVLITAGVEYAPVFIWSKNDWSNFLKGLQVKQALHERQKMTSRDRRLAQRKVRYAATAVHR